MPDDKPTNDHDLLIELRSEMRGLREDFKESANLVTANISALQVGKVDRDDFSRFLITYEKSKDDHERRIRDGEGGKLSVTDFEGERKTLNSKIDTLSRLVYIGLGILITSQFAIIVYVTYFHN
jgi:hypothetical protein